MADLPHSESAASPGTGPRGSPPSLDGSRGSEPLPGDAAPAAPGAAWTLTFSGIWMTHAELVAALSAEVPLPVRLPLLRAIEPIDQGLRYLLHLGPGPGLGGEG